MLKHAVELLHLVLVGVEAARLVSRIISQLVVFLHDAACHHCLGRVHGVTKLSGLVDRIHTRFKLNPRRCNGQGSRVSREHDLHRVIVNSRLIPSRLIVRHSNILNELDVVDGALSSPVQR